MIAACVVHATICRNTCRSIYRFVTYTGIGRNRTNSVIPTAKTVTYIRIANGSPKLTKLVWKTEAYQLKTDPKSAGQCRVHQLFLGIIQKQIKFK